MLLRGEGVDPDFGQALRWYRQAADQGLAEAQLFLGDLYVGGHGVVRDADTARDWYEKAAAQGHPAARPKLAALTEPRTEGLAAAG